jgi:hypothetical protein
MAANTVTKARAYSGSQAGAFVDTVTFTDSRTRLLVDNRSSTVHISFTVSSSGTAATPTYLGDDTYYVPAGAFRSFAFEQPVGQVKLIGSTTAMAYTVAVV